MHNENAWGFDNHFFMGFGGVNCLWFGGGKIEEGKFRRHLFVKITPTAKSALKTFKKNPVEFRF